MFSFTSSYGYDCGSEVGRIRGVQFINLGSDCWTAEGDDMARRNIKHEILHVMEFLHEMNRSILVDIKLWNKMISLDLTGTLTSL